VKIEEVEGIGPVHGARLSSAGLPSTEALLARGATPKGREELAAETGISHKLILEWVNHCDLMRLKGVGSEYADLLEAAGVDSPPELAQRNAANLTAAMVTYNESHSIVRRLPSESEVSAWIAEAKTLPRIVQH
jgi:predicted flap endonuclease-1-like 5' DNA nuclease